ncbi:hypothetical protein TOPH_06080 [Tolypocladium ophioglossoides CBS 100239]|uniref:Uncharacterized protein n=1 Tax=Tolypocladium ophioglossoides (strain CBS 100239) TaxID=1163406 RepID=A0A0L0N5D2_TOLOC|nr:hypothetical protein TOPH_06080 [Tolypocladium ophioglossoides CBS 100239]
MHKTPPTEKCQQLAAVIKYPYDGFVPDEQTKCSWTFTDDIRTLEAKELIRYYLDQIWPSINERAKQRGLRISEKIAIKPTVLWLRGCFIENNHDATTFIFLIVPSPAPAQPTDTLPSQIDWTEGPYVGQRAAIGRSRASKPVAISVEIGMTLQLDRQEILFANPSMEGVCMVMFGHNYEEIK